MELIDFQLFRKVECDTSSVTQMSPGSFIHTARQVRSGCAKHAGVAHVLQQDSGGRVKGSIGTDVLQASALVFNIGYLVNKLIW